MEYKDRKHSIKKQLGHSAACVLNWFVHQPIPLYQYLVVHDHACYLLVMGLVSFGRRIKVGF